MAVTPSQMLELGTPLPEFSLPDVTSGRTISAEELRGAPCVVAFICNHCPYVKHLKPALAEFGRFCKQKGVRMVAISSNDVASHPDDGPSKMRDDADTFEYPFPYLYDESQDVAKTFRAACTPEFYLFDGQSRLCYRGQFDDSRPNNSVAITGNDLRAAIKALLNGGQPSPEQKPSIGCNIKWKPGNAPGYFG